MNNMKSKINNIQYGVLTIILLILICIVYIVTPKLIFNYKEKQKNNIKTERQISTWENMFETTPNWPEEDHEFRYEFILKSIEECELEITEEQQERIDVLVAKIEAKLAELEESEDVSSTESDSSNGS